MTPPHSGSYRVDAAELKAQIPLSELVGLDVIWDQLKSMPAKGDHWAPCPFHQEKTASFHVDDRKGFFYCFGCGAKGDHFDYLKAQHGLDFKAALPELAQLAGIDVSAPAPARVTRSRVERYAARDDGAAAYRKRARLLDNPHPAGDDLRAAWREGWQDAENQALAENRWLSAREGLLQASEIWRASRPDHPILRAYLAARGVDVDTLGRIWRDCMPLTIRCHPSLPYMVQDRGGRWYEAHRGPAMIGLIASPEFHIGAHSGIAGIHRTWITAEGRACLDGKKLDKRWRGATGFMEPVPIRLSAPTERMIVGEGIETVLAIWSRLLADWLDGTRPFWAAEVAKSLGALAGQDDPATRRRDPATGKDWPGTSPDWGRPSWQAGNYVSTLRILAEGSAKDPTAAQRRYQMACRRHSLRPNRHARDCQLRLPGGRWDQDIDFADLAANETNEAAA